MYKLLIICLIGLLAACAKEDESIAIKFELNESELHMKEAALNAISKFQKQCEPAIKNAIEINANLKSVEYQHLYKDDYKWKGHYVSLRLRLNEAFNEHYCDYDINLDNLEMVSRKTQCKKACNLAGIFEQRNLRYNLESKKPIPALARIFHKKYAGLSVADLDEKLNQQGSCEQLQGRVNCNYTNALHSDMLTAVFYDDHLEQLYLHGADFQCNDILDVLVVHQEPSDFSSKTIKRWNNKFSLHELAVTYGSNSEKCAMVSIKYYPAAEQKPKHAVETI